MEWLYFLDLIGTAIFAITGALKAFEYRLDLLGVITLGLVTGIGGGTIRELILGETPPFILTDFNYLYIAIATSLIVFFWHRKVESHRKLFYFLDAVGLGVFAVIGSLAGIAAHLSPIGIGLIATLTAVGGGAIRDISVGEIPFIFCKEIYASAALAGTLVFQLLLHFDFAVELAAIVSIFLTSGIRIVSMRFDWNLPRAI